MNVSPRERFDSCILDIVCQIKRLVFDAFSEDKDLSEDGLQAIQETLYLALEIWEEVLCEEYEQALQDEANEET